MKFIDLKDSTPDESRIYLILIREAFSSKTRKSYAEWTDNGFVLIKYILFNDEYINGYYEE